MIECNLCGYIAKNEQNLKYHLHKEHTKVYMSLYHEVCYEYNHTIDKLCNCVKELVKRFIGA